MLPRKQAEAVRFLSVLLVFGALFHLLQPHLATEWSQEAVAHHSSIILRAWGVPATNAGRIVRMGDVRGLVVPECVGLYGIFAVAALFAAGPGKAREKLKGLAWAIPLMYAVNLLRLSTSFYSFYAYGMEAFALIHGILWKTILVLSSAIIWGAWLRSRKATSEKAGKAI